jgi:hypothetical protein
LSDHTIIRRPDCLFLCCAQNLSNAMIARIKLDDRLSVLRAGDRFRRWNSLDDQRVCSVCERKFKGRQIEIRRFSGGRYTLHCPTLGCPSGPHQWLYPRTPFASAMASQEWQRDRKPAARQSAESTAIAQAHRL